MVRQQAHRLMRFMFFLAVMSFFASGSAVAGGIALYEIGTPDVGWLPLAMRPVRRMHRRYSRIRPG
jgi:hypothetical protein